jgi:hypothetical protein
VLNFPSKSWTFGLAVPSENFINSISAHASVLCAGENIKKQEGVNIKFDVSWNALKQIVPKLQIKMAKS